MDSNTDMTTLEPADLIDRDIIAAADAHLAATSEALERAQAAHKIEQAALEVALEASELAVGGEGDPLQAAIQVEEQARRERVAHRVLARAADEHRKARKDRENAGALALKPVHKAWRLRRLAAARKGDAAAAMRAEAVAEYAQATAAMKQLVQQGLPDLFGAPLDGPVVFRTAAEEEKLWASRNIDDAHPDHPWDPGKAV